MPALCSAAARIGAVVAGFLIAASAAAEVGYAQLTLTKSGGGTGLVTSSPAAIDCGATCSGPIAIGTPVTLTASGTAGSEFTGWLGQCTGTGTCEFVITGDTAVEATFAPAPLATAVLDLDGNNGCDALTDGSIAIRYLLGISGTPATISLSGIGATRSPSQVENYLFNIRPYLDIDGNGQVDAATDGLLAMRYLFGLRGNALTADAFGPDPRRDAAQIATYLQGLCLPRHLLTVNKTGAGTGKVTSSPAGIDCGADCIQSHASGTIVTLSATADPGYAFTGWSGACAGAGACMVTVDAAKIVGANFERLICDTVLVSSSTEATDYAKAMELCETTTEQGTSPGLISAALTLASGAGTPHISSRSIRQSFGSGNSPDAGNSMVVISTGAAAATGQTNPMPFAPQLGLDTLTSSAAPADWLAANGGAFPHAPGCPAADSTTAWNPVMLTLRIRVPLNAHAFKVSAKFMSAEFPEWVCTQFNDVFVALLDSGFAGMPANPADKNLAAYTSPSALTYPVGVNLAVNATSLFTQCVNSATGCSGLSPSTINTCLGTTGLTGTGYDAADAGRCNTPSAKVGGGTDWLVIRGNVVPGEVITLRFALWDTSDGLYDSLVILDNFTWLPANVTPGTTSP